MFALMPWTRTELLPRTKRLIPEFETLLNRFLTWPMLEMPEWTVPRGLTTEERVKEFVVRVELPGFAPEEVRVEMLENRLTVEAEHPVPTEGAEARPEGEHWHVRRIVTLPPGIDPERIEAVYRNGVLEVRLPRTPEATARRIEVKT
jgi:HSP20 family protein